MDASFGLDLGDAAGVLVLDLGEAPLGALLRLLGGVQLRRDLRGAPDAARAGGVHPAEEPAQDPAEQEGRDQRAGDRQRQVIPIHRPPRRGSSAAAVKAIRRFCARPSAVPLSAIGSVSP